MTSNFGDEILWQFAWTCV